MREEHPAWIGWFIAIIIGIAFLATMFNLSFAFSVPSGINYYIAINVVNSNTLGTPANFQQMISFNALSVCNALICSNHLNNTEFFYANGTVMNSWYESANGLTNNYGSNSFSTSNNVIAWVLLSHANYIPGSGSNTVYLGFAANSVNNFNALSTTGEAPELTCSNSNTIICGAGQYAKYDNGNLIFNAYDNFIGNALSASWTVEAGTTMLTHNGISGTILIQRTATQNPFNVIEEDLAQILTGATGSRPIAWAQTTGAQYFMGTSTGFPAGQVDVSTFNGLSGNSYTGFVANALNASIYSVWAITGNAVGMVNYGFRTMNSNAFSINTGSNPGIVSPGGQNGNFINIQWWRIRNIPPGGVMPSVSFGSITNTLVISTAFTSSNSVLDYGQTQVLTSNQIAGVTPYTINMIVYNAIGSKVYNDLFTTSAASASNSFAISSAWGPGTFTANVIITDNGIPSTATNSLTFTVDTSLIANPPTPTTATIDNGQSILLTANPQGGTMPYFYQWYTTTNSCLSLTPIVGALSSTYLASPTSNTYYCYVVTDSATIPVAAASASAANIVVNGAFTSTSWTVLNPILVARNPQALNVIIAGGTAPYSYNIVLYNPLGILVYTSLGSSFSTSNDVSYTQQSIWGFGTFTANVYVTDSPYQPQTLSNTLVYTVSAPPIIVCTAQYFPLIPTSGTAYINNDTSNTMNFYATANSLSNTIIYLNGSIVNIIPPSGAGGSYIVPYNGTIKFMFANQPSVEVQCTGNPTSAIFQFDISDCLALAAFVLILMGLITQRDNREVN